MPNPIRWSCSSRAATKTESRAAYTGVRGKTRAMARKPKSVKNCVRHRGVVVRSLRAGTIVRRNSNFRICCASLEELICPLRSSNPEHRSGHLRSWVHCTALFFDCLRYIKNNPSVRDPLRHKAGIPQPACSSGTSYEGRNRGKRKVKCIPTLEFC